MTTTLNDDFVTTLECIDYQYHPDDQIHHFTFHEDTRFAVDELVRAFDKIYDHLTEDDTFYVFVDYRASGIPSIRYIMRKAGGWANSLDIHPTAYMAIATNAEFTTTILNTLLRTLNFGHLTTRFFSGEDGSDKALTWLRAN